ncbi:MAG TPA: carboxypeptidase-like regulatory domain-containing protein, partial [Candidatus Acidoferrum sp.]|nr:carboxypeptidase-like regulatory domain-containing protein [Candidatus Acidoferrum sp.]
MSSSFQKFAVRFFAAIALVMLAGTAIHAQSTVYGAIGGGASDPQEKAIVGAMVTVRNVATNATSEPVKTDSNGRFVITNLVPGMYEITVTSANFAEYKQQNIIVEVGRTTDVPVKMVLAGQTEQISVTAQAPVINAEANDFSTNLNTTAIANLPISIRRWSYFVLSTPGTVPDGT